MNRQTIAGHRTIDGRDKNRQWILVVVGPLLGLVYIVLLPLTLIGCFYIILLAAEKAMTTKWKGWQERPIGGLE